MIQGNCEELQFGVWTFDVPNELNLCFRKNLEKSYDKCVYDNDFIITSCLQYLDFFYPFLEKQVH